MTQPLGPRFSPEGHGSAPIATGQPPGTRMFEFCIQFWAFEACESAVAAPVVRLGVRYPLCTDGARGSCLGGGLERGRRGGFRGCAKRGESSGHEPAQSTRRFAFVDWRAIFWESMEDGGFRLGLGSWRPGFSEFMD